tara:strand:- start:438 stop:647 length:210 start_codon:yes stop_codon:yes gene_type:complete
MTYKILGMDYADNLEAVELHEADSVERANSWVVGYVRWGNFGGYDSINVVAPNGFTKSEYSKDFGWTHY